MTSVTAITLDDIHAAQHVFWQEYTGEDATRTWEPTIANDDAIGQEIDRRICEKLGITDAAFLAELRLRARPCLPRSGNLHGLPGSV